MVLTKLRQERQIGLPNISLIGGASHPVDFCMRVHSTFYLEPMFTLALSGFAGEDARAPSFCRLLRVNLIFPAGRD